MPTLWFCLVAAMLTVYVVLDGFDLGAGIIYLFVARTSAERAQVIRSIGPVWDGNEVWLIAAGGTLFFAFPALYASSFSGFYLPLMMVLWLLILRGTSVEFRSHVVSDLWSTFWDGLFALSGVLLAVFFGAALGNVVRGVPLDPAGNFFEPLWTNFRPAGQTGILDWYTIFVGVAALAALALHGALWVALKTEGPVHRRSRLAAGVSAPVLVLFTAAMTLITFRLRPAMFANFTARPWGFAFPALSIAGILGVLWFHRRRAERAAFLSSCAHLAGLLSSVAFSLYPRVLPSSLDPASALTVASASASAHGLKTGLAWWIVGMILVAAYTTYTYRNFSGKVSATESGETY